MLLHDTLLREDAYRTSTSDTPVCECGCEIESADHFLLYCSKYQEARNQLQDTLKEIYDLSSSQRRLHLSESLLLAPLCNYVTRKDNRLIKVAFFQFIYDTQVKL